jgi:regulator-associated protein of mTOR
MQEPYPSHAIDANDTIGCGGCCPACRTTRRLASSWYALSRPRSMLAAQAGPSMLHCAAVYEWKQECGYLYAAGDELPVPLVHVWDAAREQSFGEISTQSSAAVTCLSCAPGDTGTLVGGTANGDIFTLDIRAPTGLLSSSRCHSQGVVNAFSSELNPHTIISGSSGGELKWWDIRGGISTPYRTIRTAKAGISAIAPHPHLPLLACGSTEQAVEMFNTREGEQLNILKYQNSFLGHRIPPVHCLDFHPFAVRCTQLFFCACQHSRVFLSG